MKSAMVSKTFPLQGADSKTEGSFEKWGGGLYLWNLEAKNRMLIDGPTEEGGNQNLAFLIKSETILCLYPKSVL